MPPGFFSGLKTAATSPFAFVAYAFLVVAWAYVVTAQHRLKRISQVIAQIPEKDRAALLAREYHVLPRAGLSAAQWIRSRKHTLFFLAFLALVVAGVVLVTVALSRSQWPVDDLSKTTENIKTGVLRGVEQAELSRKYQEGLKNATVDNEVQAAVRTLKQIKGVADQYRGNINPLMRWVGATQLTEPDYVHVLNESGYLLRHAGRSIEQKGQIHPQVLWQVTSAGEQAISRSDFRALRTSIQDSLVRATRFSVGADRALYGMYWGVGLVLGSDFQCNEWQNEEAEEEAVEDPHGSHDNRLFGTIKIYVLAGTMCRETPCREGDMVTVESKPGNDYGIFGCPKTGDLVGYTEYEYAPMWHRLEGFRKTVVVQQ